MKRILVLGPVGLGPALSCPPAAEICRVDDLHAAGACTAVIVVNDGSAACVQRLQAALEFGARHPGVRVAVLTYLDPAAATGPELVRGLVAAAGELPFDQASAVLRAFDVPVRTRVTPEDITFEYQV